jgi:muramoyltetrapeptide carboxypeptidase
MKNISRILHITLFLWLSLITPLAFSETTTQKHIIVKPAALKPGDTVGLISSGSPVNDPFLIQHATERLQALGLKAKLGESVFAREGYLAGTDEKRAADLNAMFADPTVKAIIQLRGGFGSNRILELIDYDVIKKNPKIIMGFSDITTLLLAIYAKTGLITFHGPMMSHPWPAFTTQYVKAILFEGKAVTFQNAVEKEDDLITISHRIRTIRGGQAEGRILGGNLTVLTSMLGSQYLPNWKGKILFVEEVEEDIYRIDRMLTQLKLTGVLDKISGFIFGQCVDCSYGKVGNSYGSLTLMQVLEKHIKPLHIPAFYGAMIGHEKSIFTIPEGVRIKMDADKGTIEMLEKGVSYTDILTKDNKIKK